MDDITDRGKILVTKRDLKGLHMLSRSLIRDLQELRKDPRLNRKMEIMQQLDETLDTARQTKETLRELYIRESIWSKHKVYHKATQTAKKKEFRQGPHTNQWDKVGQMIHQLNQTVSYGSGKLDLPLINESVSHRYHKWWCEQSNQHLVPTIRHWLDLWCSERERQAQAAELQKFKEKESDDRLEKKSTEAEEIVAHFQKLFDVPSRDGVYTRLNDVYNRLGELMNVIHVLKDILGLDKDEPTSRVVSVVNKLCDLHSGSSTNLLRYLLQADDLDRMVLRLDAYNSFFPVFERVAAELMGILEVDSLTHVIPAVKALKLLQP